MRVVEIEAGSTEWTIEIHEDLERRIATFLGRAPYDHVSDDEIKDYILEQLMSKHEILSLDVVKG